MNHSKGPLRTQARDSPGGPVVKNPPSNAEDAGLIPGQGTKIPLALGKPSLHAVTTEPARSTPCNKRSPCTMTKSPGATARESLYAPTKSPLATRKTWNGKNKHRSNPQASELGSLTCSLAPALWSSAQGGGPSDGLLQFCLSTSGSSSAQCFCLLPESSPYTLPCQPLY